MCDINNYYIKNKIVNVEDGIKKWLKIIKESFEKKEDKFPIRVEEHKIGISTIGEKTENFIRPKEEKLEMQGEENIPLKISPVVQIPEENKLEEISPDIRKPRNINKILIIVVIILGFTIFAIFLTIFNPFFKGHEYKIFVMHNDKSVVVGNKGIAYSNIQYSIYAINRTSYCGFGGLSNTTTVNQYTFDSNTKINRKTLSDYEKEGYALSVSLFAASSNFSTDLFATTSALDFSNASLNYDELPKLSKDFSINFEIPIFNKSTYWSIISGSNLNFHIELFDNWKKDSIIYCILSREYNPVTDDNLSSCSDQLSLNLHQECLSRFFLECNKPVLPVKYRIVAVRNGTNVDCSVPLKELTSGEKYLISFSSFELIKPNLSEFYETFLGNISVT